MLAQWQILLFAFNFLLVTTTIEKDKGILRSLPPIEPPNEDEVIIKQKNLFVVLIGRNDDLLVEDERMQLKDLRKAAIEFLDNGGDVDNEGNPCDYCQGKKILHPQIIQIRQLFPYSTIEKLLMVSI